MQKERRDRHIGGYVCETGEIYLQGRQKSHRSPSPTRVTFWQASVKSKIYIWGCMCENFSGVSCDLIHRSTKF